MRKLFLGVSALLFVACSSGGGGGGGGTTTYQYELSGTAPFSTGEVSTLATAFTVKWNEANGVITGIFIEGGETKTVTGTSNGGGRTINLAVNPPESGVSKIQLLVPAGALTGTVAATIKTFDAMDVELSSAPISLDAVTNPGGGGTGITMPTISCPTGVSAATPAQGNMLELSLTGVGAPIYLCINASNTFTVVGDPSVVDGTYTYSVPGGNGYVGNLTASWDAGASKVMGAFCFHTVTDQGNVSANILDGGVVTADSGTFRIYPSNPSCP